MSAEPTLLAEIWYAAPPQLDDPDLIDALREIAPDTERQSDSLVVPHGVAVGGEPALLTVVTHGSPLDTDGKQRPDPSQTWDWAEADQRVTECSASLLVTEMFAGGADRQERVSALAAVVRVLVRRTRPVLVSWPLSQRVTPPEEDAGDLDGLINIRMFEATEGSTVMDSLGLHLVGLRDVQCHFVDRDAGEIAALLHSTAGYLFEAGDVIADGHTISGLDGEGAYVCRLESALVAPIRTVLDIDLGEPYAAGDRSR